MIGILTFHWADDYGAMLQAYALKYCLEKAGKKEVEVIPYTSVKLEGRYWLFPVIGKERGKKIQYQFMPFGVVRNIFYLSRFLKRRKTMKSFRRLYLTGKPTIRKADRVFLEKYSCVFVGSDQIWNPEITVGLDDVYIGNIKEKGNCKLIAYGASLGKDALPGKYQEEFTKAVMENFSMISMREKSAVPYVKGFFRGNVIDVLDPTLLVGKEEWKRIGKSPEERGYILFIYTEYNEQMLRHLRELSEKLNRKVIQISMPWSGRKEDWIDLRIEGGPMEYIGFFQNAGYIVTNSFHGTVFSILMEKQFLVFGHSSRNARMENLVERLHLKSRLVERGRMPSKEEMLREIDWGQVRELLEKERELSMGFIKNALDFAGAI